MNVVLGLGLFIVGALVGFFANRTLFSSAQESQKLAAKASQSEAELARYKLDVAEHLESSAKLLEQMNSTCQTAMTQMAQSTQLLQQVTPENIESMPFFSKETQEQLAQTVNLRHNKGLRKNDESISEPPLDYSGAPSGLFDDKKHSVTNAESNS
ncbi:MAG: YhcB family protein [Cognaticolwellia sp.]